MSYNSNDGFFPGYPSYQNRFNQESSRSPPIDPRSNYYQVICYVCKEVSKPDEPHSLHYGGVVCLSCRAFFRRAHQKTRNPYFICKRGDVCDVTVATRRRCQKCRYVRCLAAGMNPNAVLTDEEKVVRFRKTIMKKLRNIEGSPNDNNRHKQDYGHSNDDDDERFDISDAEDLETLESRIDTKDLQLSPSVQKLDDDLAIKFKPTYEFPITARDMSYTTSTNPEQDPGILLSECDATLGIRRLVQSICHSYHMIANADHLINLFFSKVEVNRKVVEEELTFLQKQLAEQFSVFAKSQSNFSNLCPTDQKTLLSRNTRLFAPYCFACCIFSSNTELQSTGPDVFDQLFLDSNQAKKIEAISKIFHSDTNLSRLDQLMRKFYPIIGADSMKIRAVLVYIVIFARDSNTQIGDEILLREVEFENSGLVEAVLAGRNFTPYWISLLEEMSEIFDQSFAWEDFERWKCIGAKSVALGYTIEEELWLKNQLAKLDEAHRSVPFGEETTNEFMMYTLEVPVSKKFMKAVFSVALERMKRTLECHREYQELSADKQFQMMNLNGPAGLALTVARYESNTNGTVQMLESFGGSEEQTWNENYQPILKTKSKVKKITMPDVVRQKSVNLTQEQLDHFVWLTQEMHDVAADDELYRIIKLLALFKMNEVQTTSADLCNLSNIYSMLIKRRIDDIFRNRGKTRTGLTSNITKNFCNPEECYRKIEECLCHAQSLAEILTYIMNTSK